MRRNMFKSGFTLVELLMVIAIIGIISMLAIQKLSGLKDDAKEKINLANLQRVASGIETYVAAHAEDYSLNFNKLDSLMMYTAATGAAGDTSASALEDISHFMIYTNQADNVGLSSIIFSGGNTYAVSGAKLLGSYALTASDIEVLERDLGIRFVMAGYPERESAPGSAYGASGEDMSYVSGSPGDPDTCASIAVSNKVGRLVAVVNPGATRGRTPVGPAVYKAMGEDVYYGLDGNLYVKGKSVGNANEDAYRALMTGEGVLFAYGLGENCALIGNNEAGFDSAPLCPTMKANEYRRYIVLVRMRYTAANGRNGTTYTARKAEFAGVMDSAGNVLSMLR